MLDKVAVMFRFVFVVMVVVAGACTKPNPRSCADGTCTDPGFPFCDVDGALEGQPDVCVAVSCNPTEVVACRDDVAVRCNAQGTNYDLVQCQLGCDVATGGCQSCSDNNQCGNPSPVCDDVDHTCRSCRLDSECDSLVCGDGSCAAEASIAYASATGSPSGDCNRLAPCTIARAVEVATTSSGRATVRLLPELFTEGVTIDGSHTLTLVGTGSTLMGAKVSILNGADVTLRGFTFRLADSNDDVVTCGSASSAHVSLLVEDSLIAGERSIAFRNQNCAITARRTEFQPDTPYFSAVFFGTNGSFDGDRLLIHPLHPDTQQGAIGANASNVTLRLTNSLLEETQIDLRLLGGSGVMNQVRIAFNTMVFRTDEAHGGQQVCTIPSFVPHMVLFEDNIILTTGSAEAFVGADCTLTNNILFPETTRPNNFSVDPQLIDFTARDYRLKPTSPAHDAAMPSSGLVTDHDLVGTMRPQGAAPDIGAYELVP